MKKVSLYFSLLLLCGINSYASIARLTALGQNNNGSFYIRDFTNILLNPAYINHYHNFGNIEFGSDTSSPTAQGQLYVKTGKFHWGAYIGRDTNNNRGSFLDSENTHELTIGRNYKNYSLGITTWFSKSSQDTTSGVTKKEKSHGIRIGSLGSFWGAYLELDLENKASGASVSEDEWKADTGIKIGGKFEPSDEDTLFMQIDKGGYSSVVNMSDTDYEEQTYLIGYGSNKSMGQSVNYFWDLTFNYQKNTTRVASATKVRTKSLPLTIGFETYDKLDLINFRASLSQNIQYNQRIERNNSLETKGDGTTAITMGLTFNYDKFKVEGTISTIASGQLNIGSNTISNISANYWF